MLIITPSQRRRFRRTRATAKLRLWLHQRHFITLDRSQILQYLKTLSRHHSADKRWIRALLKVTMASTPPWKCLPCRRLVKASVSYCPACGGHWTATQDASYTGTSNAAPKSPRRPKSPRNFRQDAWEIWNWNETWDQQQWPELRTKSPRGGKGGSAKGKDKSKDKGKGKDKGKQVEPAWTPPNLALGSSSSSAPKESQEAGQYRQLLALLKQKHQDLPPEVQTALQATQIADSKNITKQLHSAVSQLGAAKKQLAELAQARTQLHQQWTTFIKDSVERWKQYASDFQEQDAKIVAKIEEATQKHQSSQENFKQCQMKAGESGQEEVIEIEADEEIPDLGMHVEHNLQQMVSSLEDMQETMEKQEQSGKKRKKDEPPDKSGNGGSTS